MKKGFTLVELVATLSVLAIIIAMVVIDVNYFSKQRKDNEYNNLVTIIEENTKVLVNTNAQISQSIDRKLRNLQQAKQSDSSVVVTCKLSYEELINNNLMDRNTVNPINNKKIDGKSYIKISLDSSDEYKYEFIYTDEEELDDIDNCLN